MATCTSCRCTGPARPARNSLAGAPARAIALRPPIVPGPTRTFGLIHRAIRGPGTPAEPCLVPLLKIEHALDDFCGVGVDATDLGQHFARRRDRLNRLAERGDAGNADRARADRLGMASARRAHPDESAACLAFRRRRCASTRGPAAALSFALLYHEHRSPHSRRPRSTRVLSFRRRHTQCNTLATRLAPGGIGGGL